YAATTLQMNPACLNIAYLDPTMRVHQSHPPEVDLWKPILDVRSHPLMYSTVERAARTLRPMLSPTMQMFGRTWGFVLVETDISVQRISGICDGDYGI